MAHVQFALDPCDNVVSQCSPGTQNVMYEYEPSETGTLLFER
jgi:hypothetical protein